MEVCYACLSSGRSLSLLNETDYFSIYSQILEEISVCPWKDGVRVCWECLSMLRCWAKFKKDVQQATLHLIQHGTSPPLQSLPRLDGATLYTDSYGQKVPLELKDENSVHDISLEDMPIMFVDELAPPAGELEPGYESPGCTCNEINMEIEISTPKRKPISKKKKKKKRKLKPGKSSRKKLKDLITFEEDIKLEKEQNTEKNDSKISVSNSTEFIPVSNSTECILLSNSTECIPVSNSTECIPVSNSTECIPVSNSTECLPVSYSTECLPVSNSTECIPVSNSTECLPVSNSTECLPVSFSIECIPELDVTVSNDKLTEKQFVKPKNKKSTKKKKELTGEPFCDICKKTFKNKKTHSHHMSTLHGSGGKHECMECGRRYQWKSNLARHIRSHKAVAAGELYCRLCDKRFASIATLRIHLALSSKHMAPHDKPFICEECGARFVNKTQIRDHIDWEHQHKIKYRCKLCSKAFKTGTSRYIHFRNVHLNKGRKDILCHICGKAYQNVCKLQSHVAACHGAAPAFRCPCGATFSWLSSYHRHRRQCASKSPNKKSKT